MSHRQLAILAIILVLLFSSLPAQQKTIPNRPSERSGYWKPPGPSLTKYRSPPSTAELRFRLRDSLQASGDIRHFSRILLVEMARRDRKIDSANSVEALAVLVDTIRKAAGTIRKDRLLHFLSQRRDRGSSKPSTPLESGERKKMSAEVFRLALRIDVGISEMVEGEAGSIRVRDLRRPSFRSLAKDIQKRCKILLKGL